MPSKVVALSQNLVRDLFVRVYGGTLKYIICGKNRNIFYSRQFFSPPFLFLKKKKFIHRGLKNNNIGTGIEMSVTFKNTDCFELTNIFL